MNDAHTPAVKIGVITRIATLIPSLPHLLAYCWAFTNPTTQRAVAVTAINSAKINPTGIPSTVIFLTSGIAIIAAIATPKAPHIHDSMALRSFRRSSWVISKSSLQAPTLLSLTSVGAAKSLDPWPCPVVTLSPTTLIPPEILVLAKKARAPSFAARFLFFAASAERLVINFNSLASLESRAFPAQASKLPSIISLPKLDRARIRAPSWAAAAWA